MLLYCHRSIIDFGGYADTLLNIIESFSLKKCLDNFMQGFIDCTHADDEVPYPAFKRDRLILDVNVGGKVFN